MTLSQLHSPVTTHLSPQARTQILPYPSSHTKTPTLQRCPTFKLLIVCHHTPRSFTLALFDLILILREDAET